MLARNSFSTWKFAAADDDVSTTSLQSTVTVDATPVKQPCQDVPRRPRRVRFADDDNNNIYHATHYKEDCAALWYTKTELKRFKALTISTARAIGSTVSPTGVCFNYTTVLLTAYDACCQTLTERTSSPLSATEAQHLQILCTVSVDRVGLESLAIDAIRHDKQVRRVHVVDAVMALQERGTATADDLRQTSMAISRAPRLYARVVAHAQAAAAV